MITMTVEDLQAIETALRLSVDELTGVEETPIGEDYVLTTGALEACQDALHIVYELLDNN